MKLFRGILTLPLLLGLYACNNDDAKVEKDVTGKNNTVNTTDTNVDTNTDTGNELTGVKVEDVNYTFTKFDLDVEYENGNSYDVEYENDGKNIYAELENGPNSVTYKGDKAYENIVNALKQLTFDETTSDEDVRKEVLKAFTLEENYQSFELEVKFQNGAEKHYHHKK